MKFRNRVLCGSSTALLLWGLPPSVEAQFSQQVPKLVGTGAIGLAEHTSSATDCRAPIPAVRGTTIEPLVGHGAISGDRRSPPSPCCGRNCRLTLPSEVNFPR
jgi:hypothetical protein